MKVALAALVLLGFPLAAQDAPAPQNPAAPTTAPATTVPAAVPAADYSDQEFPTWMLKLRRAEILTVGAFPLAYLFAGLGYDYQYYFANGRPSSNAPWPVGPGTSQWTTTSQPRELQQKNVTLLGIAIGASLAVAFADWLLGL